MALSRLHVGLAPGLLASALCGLLGLHCNCTACTVYAWGVCRVAQLWALWRAGGRAAAGPGGGLTALSRANQGTDTPTDTPPRDSDRGFVQRTNALRANVRSPTQSEIVPERHVVNRHVVNRHVEGIHAVADPPPSSRSARIGTPRFINHGSKDPRRFMPREELMSNAQRTGRSSVERGCHTCIYGLRLCALRIED